MKDKKRIKLLLLVVFAFLLSVCAFGKSRVFAYDATGHSEFRTISFVHKDQKLLVEYRDDEIKDLYKKINRRVFGWSTYYMAVDEKVSYDGNIVFSRSNKTSSPISFEYVLKETEITKRAVTVSGSVSAKVSGTVQKINLGIGVEAKASITDEDSISYTSDAKTGININIMPRTKVTLIETGEGYLTSGVSKYYFFGISLRKGNWERIDVDTLYFELREERY